MFTHARVLRVAILLSLISAAIPAADAQDATAIVEELKSKIGEFNSFSADMTMLMTMSGMTINTTGDVIVLDERMAMNMNMNMSGMDMATRSVTDESGVMWTETNVGGMKQIMKMDMKKIAEMGSDLSGIASPSAGPGGNPLEAIEQMLETFDMTFDGKDTIDGVEVYRLSAEIEDEQNGGMDPTGQMAQMGITMEGVTMAFGVEDGFPREYSMLGSDGKPVMAMTYSNLVINPDIDPKIFEYTPPEGTQVMDMTAMMEQQIGVTGDASGGKFALGSPAPEFTGTDLNGDAVGLSDYKGKVVLIDFWASSNAPYVRELPNMIDAYTAYHDKGFEIVAISLDDSKDDLVAFLKEHPKMTWVQLFDGKGWDADIAVKYDVEAIPFTLLLDQEGIVVRQDLRGEALANALADLLGG